MEICSDLQISVCQQLKLLNLRGWNSGSRANKPYAARHQRPKLFGMIHRMRYAFPAKAGRRADRYPDRKAGGEGGP